MAAIVHSDKAQKAIKKIKGAMQDYPLGIEFGELITPYLNNIKSMICGKKSMHHSKN